MRVIKKRFEATGRNHTIKIVPIGDVHIGAAACNEKLLEQVVDNVAAEPDTYWLSMGDVANFINVSDPRFDPEELARWIKTQHLSDLSKAQLDRYLSIIKPIASKCLCAVEGNHEQLVRQKYERDIYAETVAGIKQLGGMTADTPLAIGYTGYLLLAFRGKDGMGSTVKISLHHGFSSGKAAMQRWLWTHDADISIFGHTHNTGVQTEAVETISERGIVKIQKRFGCYAGTFLSTSSLGSTSYSEKRGYATLPLGGIEVRIAPYKDQKISVLCN